MEDPWSKKQVDSAETFDVRPDSLLPEKGFACQVSRSPSQSIYIFLTWAFDRIHNLGGTKCLLSCFFVPEVIDSNFATQILLGRFYISSRKELDISHYDVTMMSQWCRSFFLSEEAPYFKTTVNSIVLSCFLYLSHVINRKTKFSPFPAHYSICHYSQLLLKKEHTNIAPVPNYFGNICL